jgi:hypothetical protein
MRSTLFSLSLLLGCSTVSALTSYANDFVDPDFILAGKFGENTLAAQETIKSWAQELAVQGPWSSYQILIFYVLFMNENQ